MAAFRNKVVVFSHDLVGPRMAGPGVRYYRLAQALAREFEVVLVAPAGSEPAGELPLLTFRTGADPTVGAAVRKAHVAVVPVSLVPHLPVLAEEPWVPVVVDGYDPLLAETLMLGADADAVRSAQTLAALRGDFFICAGERQRDWWLGWLEAVGRVNPHTWAEDPTLRRLVDVVPSGIPDEPLPACVPVARRIWPDLPADAELLLWGGGLWPWLDPLTAIRALVRIRAVRPQACLIFPGVRHPNPGMVNIPTHHDAAVSLARSLGLLGRAVFFSEWTPYSDWPGLLAESRVGLSLHLDTVEARLAFRGRILDYIWAALPVVATRGDETAGWVERYGLGILVEPGDEAGVARAALTLLGLPRESLHSNFEAARRALSWSEAVRPLMAFCRMPRCAPDRVQRDGAPAGPSAAGDGSVGRRGDWVNRLRRWLAGS